MTITYQAPAKLNLSLHVKPPRADGYHPLQSLVQTVEWWDRLSVSAGEGSDQLEVRGSHLTGEGNLVGEALSVARTVFEVPPLSMVLEKELPVAAGLGGGSSDAAAALIAAADAVGFGQVGPDLAVRVGADVALFLIGGTVMLEGIGETLTPMREVAGFAVAVVVPEFGLETADVYARWDVMEGPEGEAVPDEQLPPPLRGEMPMRNDLLPAALGLEPRLGDFISDIREAWGVPVCLTGSGSACFGYFPSLDEAADAATTVSSLCSVAKGVALRDHGVSRE